MHASFIPAADLGEIPAQVRGALFGGVDACCRWIFILDTEDWSCRGTTFCFGRTSLLVSPVACAIRSVTHFSCSNFLPVSLNGRDLPHSQCSPTVVLYFSLHQQAQWGQTRGNFSTSAALTSSESKHFPYRINPLCLHSKFCFCCQIKTRCEFPDRAFSDCSTQHCGDKCRDARYINSENMYNVDQNEVHRQLTTWRCER